MHVKKGDKVKVLTGAHKGKTGAILAAYPKSNRVVVEGINSKKKHVKKTRGGKAGQVSEKLSPIHASNVQKV